jgi:hypothetical protein
VRTRASRSAIAKGRSVPAMAGGGTGRRNATRASSPASTPTVVKGTSGPVAWAIAPSTGPSSTPANAALIAVPIVVPRCSGGASEISQPIPPAHAQAPPIPSRKRVESSTATLPPNPNTTLESDISPRPNSSVLREPARVASQPLGSVPSTAPAA